MSQASSGDPSASTSYRPKHAHITSSSASLAMKNLDRHAFPSLISLQSADMEPHKQQQQQRRLRVADVDVDASLRERPSRFSSLIGIDGYIHRERARQRKQQREQARNSLLSRRKEVRHKANDIQAWLGDDVRNTDPRSASSASYQPFSLSMLLKRVATFSISTYSSKPDACRLLSPLGMAMHGWERESGQARDEVSCVTCSAAWKVAAPPSATKEENARIWKEIERGMQEHHAPSCPWLLRSCHPSLFRVPIGSRLEIQAEVGRQTNELDQCPGFDRLRIESELPKEAVSPLQAELKGPSSESLQMALFGWHLSEGVKPVQECVVACRFCARRAGLWSFFRDAPPGRAFHVAREHKTYCPIVNGEVQSGKWLDLTSPEFAPGQVVQQTKPYGAALPGWQLKFDLLLSGKDRQKHVEQSEDAIADQTHFRTMRSHELLAHVKSLVGK